MKILLTGATGFIGDHLLRALRHDGHDVTAAVRDPHRLGDRDPAIKTVAVDFAHDHDVAAWTQRVAGFDVVINAVGIIRQHGAQSFAALHTATPIALFRACALAGAQRVIQISALGADSDARSEYHLSKRAADDVLATLPLEWVILQPSIVYGPRAKSFAFFKALAASPLIPIVADGQQPIQPIHIDDLVHAVRISLSGSAALHQRIPLVGPTPITMREFLQQLRTWLGRGRARFVSIPYAAALTIGKIAGVAGNTPLTAETVQMLQRGNTGDVMAYQNIFQRMPATLGSVLDASPAQQADQWHAGLYLLMPALRLSLVFVWLVAGVVSLGLYPVNDSFELLARVGVPAEFNYLFLITAALLDILLGVAFLLRWRVTEVGLVMIALMLAYSVIVALSLPEYLAHPYGPIAKNLPLLIATLVVMQVEGSRT